MPKNRHMLVSTKEAAQQLNEHERTVQRKAESGEYPAQKMPGLRGAYVFLQTDLNAILAKRRREAERLATSEAVA